MTWITNEKFITWVIVVNTTALFLDAFPSIHALTDGWLAHLDKVCISLFALEAIIKIKKEKKGYFQKGWNQFDLIVTLVSLPALLPFPPETTSWASVLRTGRILRFLRLLKFIPNSNHLAAGIQRALKASIGVFAALALLNFTLAIAATLLFGHLSPEHFGNPLKSSYSLLKMFTVEGWYEIPDQIAQSHPKSWMAHALRTYAILTVLFGGILGMGLANAVFIDEMTADNTEKMERLLEDIQKDLKKIQVDLKEIQALKNPRPPA